MNLDVWKKWICLFRRSIYLQIIYSFRWALTVDNKRILLFCHSQATKYQLKHGHWTSSSHSLSLAWFHNLKIANFLQNQANSCNKSGLIIFKAYTYWHSRRVYFANNHNQWSTYFKVQNRIFLWKMLGHDNSKVQEKSLLNGSLIVFGWFPLLQVKMIRFDQIWPVSTERNVRLSK